MLVVVAGTRFFFSASSFLKASPELCGGTAGRGGRALETHGFNSSHQELSHLSCECVPVMEGAAERGNKCMPLPQPSTCLIQMPSRSRWRWESTFLHECKLTPRFVFLVLRDLRRLEGKQCLGVFICAHASVRASACESMSHSCHLAASSLSKRRETATSTSTKESSSGEGQNGRHHLFLTSLQAQATAH